MSARRVLLGLFVVLAVVGSLIPIGLAEDLPRHRDPLDFGPEPPNLAGLQGLYGSVFKWTMAENFPMALSGLDFSGFVFAPEATKAVMDRFTTLFGSAIQDFNLTKSDIEAIRAYLRRLKPDEAKAAIAVALARLGGTNVTIGSMDLSAGQLAAILKGSPQEMLAGGEGLRALIGRYRGELLALLGETEDLSEPIGPIILPNGTVITDPEFIRTKLRISVEPTEVLVGSVVRVWGNLTDSTDVGLASRKVEVFIDNDLVESVITDESGSFDLGIPIPFVYRDHVTVSAQYLGDIIGNRVYLPCSSNDVRVNLVYYTPVISVDLPKTVYPGKSFL
ncbi:MAG: hypothetical protein Q8O47_04545, partial [Candidatus Bathyarchaeota archaeon]|nr:hypothetical protein [Candidatus Bathyarchaeota archaeon]